LFALPAMLTGLVLGEPPRRVAVAARRGFAQALDAVVGPLAEFLGRRGALLVLLFVLLHKIGDTLANLTLRLLLNDLGFSNEEIATWDVGLGFFAYLAGIFIGGALYAQLGMKRSVLVSLLLMAVSNLSFAGLAALGHSNALLGFAIGFENIASGIGGVVVVAYLSALCNLAFTATQFALLSAAASVVGRLLTGTTAGALIESLGYVQFYVLTFVVALPGVFLYLFMLRAGLIDQSLGQSDGAGGAGAK
jgi:PAT family beta-lactamase induction signal transducer AmpG